MDKKTFSRRDVLKLAGASAGFLAMQTFSSCKLASAQGQKSKPNVVLFLVDDLGFGDVGWHGNPHAKTPNMDAFAAQATEFTQFRVSPVCSPTRASLMTGRYNFRTGVSDVAPEACKMDPAELTIAERLRDAGYATGIFGKWHLGDGNEYSPNAQGFQEALYHVPGVLHGYFNPDLMHNGKPQQRKGYCMDIFTDAAIDFIKQNKSNPFFVYLPANLIHTPLQVSQELTSEFKDLGLNESTQKIYGMTRSVDNNFGKLRNVLNELGLEENTLFILTSDNGPCFSSKPLDRHTAGQHGLKGTPYEGGIHVPCCMRWPIGFSSPAKVTRHAMHLDVLPTVLDACGVPDDAKIKLDGRSLMPLLKNPDAKWADRTMFFQWDSGQIPRRGHSFAVLDSKWKLVQPCGMDKPRQKGILDTYTELCRLQGRGERLIYGTTPKYELYDIVADPGERKDLAAEHPEIVEKMKKEYDDWFTDVCARWQTQKNLSSK